MGRQIARRDTAGLKPVAQCVEALCAGAIESASSRLSCTEVVVEPVETQDFSPPNHCCIIQPCFQHEMLALHVRSRADFRRLRQSSEWWCMARARGVSLRDIQTSIFTSNSIQRLIHLYDGRFVRWRGRSVWIRAWSLQRWLRVSG